MLLPVGRVVTGGPGVDMGGFGAGGFGIGGFGMGGFGIGAIGVVIGGFGAGGFGAGGLGMGGIRVVIGGAGAAVAGAVVAELVALMMMTVCAPQFGQGNCIPQLAQEKVATQPGKQELGACGDGNPAAYHGN